MQTAETACVVQMKHAELIAVCAKLVSCNGVHNTLSRRNVHTK